MDVVFSMLKAATRTIIVHETISSTLSLGLRVFRVRVRALIVMTGNVMVY